MLLFSLHNVGKARVALVAGSVVAARSGIRARPTSIEPRFARCSQRLRIRIGKLHAHDSPTADVSKRCRVGCLQLYSVLGPRKLAQWQERQNGIPENAQLVECRRYDRGRIRVHVIAIPFNFHFIGILCNDTSSLLGARQERIAGMCRSLATANRQAHITAKTLQP